MVMLDEKWWLMFTRPLTLLFLVLTVLALIGPTLWAWFKKRSALKASGEVT
jgi:putative tricarboxylic transport membrane protein